MEDMNELVICKMVTGGEKTFKKLTVKFNNGQVDQFIEKSGSIEKAKEILEYNHCSLNADQFLKKEVQGYPIFYAFIREYCKVKKLQKQIKKLVEENHNIREAIKNEQ